MIFRVPPLQEEVVNEEIRFAVDDGNPVDAAGTADNRPEHRRIATRVFIAGTYSGASNKLKI
jgi:hypothetical protein